MNKHDDALLMKAEMEVLAMSDFSQRIANLSPEKRALLEQHLMKKGTGEINEQEIPNRGSFNQCPVSFAQQRLWFLDQFEPGSPIYNIPIAARLRGPLDVTAFEQSLNAIMQRHEALRTIFSTVQEEPRQLILPSMPLTLTMTDLQELPEANREVELHQLATQEAQRPFDLGQGPLLRATLLHLDENYHILLLTIHHIVSDGWSMDVFFRELSELYKAFTTGNSFRLPELPIQYADFSIWQRQWLQGELLKKQLGYWKKQLDNARPLLQIPSDHPRPAIQSNRGALQSLILPPYLTEDLKALSRQEEVTLFMLLLAVFKTLLYRYTGREDIIIGSPIANRTRVEIEGLIGFFVNTLVLRTDLSNNPTFRQLLGRVRKVCLEAYAHQDLPFEKLVEEFNPERNLSYSPMFQVMFILQNTPKSSLELPYITLEPLDVDSRTSKFDLTLSMVEEPEGLRGTLEYDTALFDAQTIKRMAGHFQALLEAIVADPEQRLSELPLLTTAESHQLLLEWNDTKIDYPREVCIHHLFEKQVERTPEATALIIEDQQMTYQELNCWANQLAHFLKSHGVAPDTMVGICMARSFELVVGVLGILKAGGVYVPLDPAYPEKWLTFILRDTKVPILLTHNPSNKNLPESHPQILNLDAIKEILSQEREDNPISGVEENHPAYIIYTSGSTGIPKGIVGLHRGAVNRFKWMWQTFPFQEGEICCQKTSLNFVDSVWEIFGPLLKGVPTVLIPNEIVKDPYSFVKALSAESVSRIVIVPSLLRILFVTFENLQSHLPKLKFWITSGEELSAELAQQFYEHMPQSMLLNLYGSSEVSADCTWYDTKKGSLSPRVPIGRPIYNTQIYLFDSNLQLVPIGIPGELHVGGAGLAGGYLNQSDWTKKSFIQNPFLPDSQIFKTGDLARYRSDGNLEFLGRVDHQVKIRGYRIELGEIESVLSTHPMIRKNVVIVREDITCERRMVAFLIANNDDVPSEVDLVRFLKKRLPDYMVPAAFVFLDTLPSTPNGKVDRKALINRDLTDIRQVKEYVAPQDALEIRLTKVWEKVLNRKPIGIRDNFFELGGHSLLAVRLFFYMEQIIGQRLPLGTLFKAPTIEQLAHIIRDDSWQAPWSSMVEIQPIGSRPPLFLIHAAGGNVLLYRNLALLLGADQPVYGLQSKGLEGRQPFHTRVEEMAFDYAMAIKQVQPEGPYLLGGYCLGGSIALEIARQLRARGDEVALLALFETYNWVNIDIQSNFDQFYFYIQKLIFHWQNFRLLRAKQKLTFLKEKLKVLKERQKIWYGMIVSNLRKNSRRYIGEAQHLYKLWENNDRATKIYKPKIYPGRIIHFRPIKEYAKFNTPEARWENIATEGVKTYRLPVYPAGMLIEPFVKILAEKLKESLAELRHE